MFEAFQLLWDKLHKDTNDENNYWKKRVVNCKDLEGNTVLHISTIRNQAQVIESLVTYNKSNPGTVEVNAKNERNQTAMDMAELFNRSHIQQLLREMVADTNANSNEINQIPENIQQISGNEVPPPPRHHHHQQDTNNNNVLSREEVYNWKDYFEFNFGKSSPEKARSDLLVVAVLMATATYQAVLNPPGGIDDKTGVAILTKSDTYSRYVEFMVFNSAGFFISLNMIIVLMYKYPLYWELYAAMFAMVYSYSSALGGITPKGKIRDYLALFVAAVPILIYFTSFKLRKCIKRCIQRRLAHNRGVNNA